MKHSFLFCRKQFFTFCLLLTLAALSSADNSTNTTAPTVNHIPMTEGVTYANHLYEMNGKIFYKFEVGPTYPENEDLVVITVPTHLGADPDILISTTNPTPQDFQSSEIICTNMGYDICVLPSEKIQPNKTIYIAVYCQFWCDFEVTVQFSKVLNVTAPDEVPIYLDKNGFKQIKVRIPVTEKPDHLNFEVNYKDFKNASSMLNLFLNKGEEDPTSSSYTLSGVPAWNEGVVISITKENGQYCIDCVYSLLVHGEPNSALQFRAQIAHEMYDIGLNTRYDETLGYGQTLYYKLELSAATLEQIKNQTLNFELMPYLGDPNIYVHPGVKPATLEGYQWKANSSVIESLTLTSEGRNLSESVYHIAVNSFRTAVFSLIVYPSKKNGKKMTFGMSETGFVKPAEIINFLLDVPLDQDDLKIEATLHNVYGSSELYIMPCFNANQTLEVCEISAEDIQNAKIGKAPQIDSSWQTSADNQVRFLFNSTVCEQSGGKTCRYVAAVAGSGNLTSRYELIITYREKHIIMRDRIPIKNTLEVGEEAHYRFTLPDDTSVAAMVFQLTPISGIPQLYASKTLTYPTTTEYQKVACGCNHMIVYCGRSQFDVPLKSAYYLTVHAFTHTVYTLTAYIMAWSEKSVLQLYQNQPQKFAFRDNNEPAYFKISIPEKELSHEILRISLTPINGVYKMYLGQEFIPDPAKPETYIASTESNTLILDPSSLEIIRNNSFYITVAPQGTVSNADDASSKLQFVIQYSALTGLVRIQEGHPQDIRLRKNEPQFFQFNANFNDELIRFTATVFSGDVSIYASGIQQYPAKDSSEFSGNKSSLYSIEVETSKLCLSCNSNGSRILPVYIGIYPENNEDAQLTFSIARNKTILSIQDGVSLEFLVPSFEKQLHFYSHPSESPFLVAVESDSQLKVFVSMVNINATPSQLDWRFPNAQSNMPLARAVGGKYSVEIDPQNCKECVLGITITSSTNSSQQQKGSLLVTTQSRRLQSGTAFTDSVKGNSYKYYNFELTDSSLSASVYLTPLGSCSPVLYLSQGRANLPSQTNFNLTSNDTVAPSITISTAGQNQGESYYSLAVFNGKSGGECSYSLTFSSQNIKFLGLKTGIPQELDLSPGQTDLYLTYVDSCQQSIKLLVARDVGDSNLFVKVLSNNANRTVSLPSDKDFEFNTNSIYTKDFIHIPQRSTNSELCEYIINVQNNEKNSNSKLSLIVTTAGTATLLYPGRTYRDFVNSSIVNKYAYTQGSLKEEEIELTLTIYSGEPVLAASTNEQQLSTNPRWKQTSAESQNSAGPKVITIKISRGSSPHSDVKENDPIFYQVTSVADSYYDVTLKAANKNTMLQPGKFVEGTLNPHQDLTFTFLTLSDVPLEGDKTFTLSIISLSENKSPPKLKVLYLTSTNQGANESTIVPDFEKTVGNVRSLGLPRQKGVYKFILSSAESQPIKYSLIFNYKNEVFLPLNTPVYDTVTKEKTQFYRIYIANKGQLQLEIYHCYGQATFLLERENRKDSSSSTQKEKFNLLTPTDHYSFTTYEVEEGYYTAKVSARETIPVTKPSGVTANETGYKLSAMFLGSNVTGPRDLIFPGDSGNVKFELNDDALEFNWLNIVMDEELIKAYNKTYQGKIEYTQQIVVSDSLLHLTMYAKCGMASFTEFNVNGTPKLFITKMTNNIYDPMPHASIPFNFTSGVMYATVVATVEPRFEGPYKDYHTPVPVFYKTVTIQTAHLSKNNARTVGIVICTSVALLIVLLLVLKVVREKLMKTEKRLHFEMTSSRSGFDQVGIISSVGSDSNSSVSVDQSASYDEA